MSKLGVAGAAMGVGGTGAAGVYGAYHLGVFGGSGIIGEVSEAFQHTQAGNGNHVTYDVKKKKDSGGQELDLDPTINPLKFDTATEFVVKVIPKTLGNVNTENHGQSVQTTATSSSTCTFKFQVTGDQGSKTIKEDYKKRIFWEDTNNQKWGLFGLLSKSLNGIEDSSSSGATENRWTKADAVAAKNKFTQACEEHNKNNNNQEILIKFKKDTSGNDLVPDGEEIFNKWFLEDKDKNKTFGFSQGT